MYNILTTVIPIFIVIGAGWAARRKDLVSAEFLESGNWLVFYLAIPAMVFRSITRVSISGQVNLTVIWISLSAVLLVYLGVWIAAWLSRVQRSLKSTFIQSTIHGNLGYIGLAVAFYYLGDDGLARASFIAGFIMICQNLLGVIVLQVHAPEQAEPLTLSRLAVKIIGNPIIVSAFAGILVAWAGFDLPVFVDRILKIVGSLALPLALLIIGGSLSFNLPRKTLGPLIFSMAVKLGLLPAAALGLFIFMGIPSQDYLPALILLAAPTATVCYVMARELHGDTEFAVIAISLSTLASAVTFSIWLHWA